MPMEPMTGRVAVVTGAASGIGLGIAEALGRAGVRVLMTDIDEDSLAAATAHVRQFGADVLSLQVDVRDADAVERAGAAAVEHFGGLHIAVNNAGVVNGGPSWELSLDDWHRVIDVNIWGVIHGVRAFVPRILATGEGGHVVNIASMAAVLPFPGIGPYTASKHAVLGLTDVLRADLAEFEPVVGVSVVMPGMVRTGMNPVGLIEPAVVAANVLDAIRTRRPYVFTDDQATEEVEQRVRAILGARSDVITNLSS
jgi:NAD(P)-dependent dehydrogenase (short-subunit alcohol dehydrogenase family)